MIIENAKYTYSDNKSIKATIDGVQNVVPVNTDNRHYKEILKQVADGDITIAEAD
jgi:hypothetical protein